MTGDRLIHEVPDGAFHDDSIYGIRLTSPEPDRDDWRSEIVLDIDHIIEGFRSKDGQVRFRLVQANLCFANVSDLHVSFAMPDFSIVPLPIDRIVRSDDPVVERRENYREFRWSIHLNDGAGGSLTFRSSGFRQEQVSEPAEFDDQTIPGHLRINS